MILYFVNGSKQKKKIIESDYGEDIIDMIIDFFETHNRFPHMMDTCSEGSSLFVRIINSSEHFLVEDIDIENASTIKEWIDGGDYHG